YRLDSQAKYAVVAAGEAEIYLRLTRHTGYVENIWDHAAGALVVEEAGGKLTDLNGERLDFSRGPRLEKNVGIVASNGRFHDRIPSNNKDERDSSVCRFRYTTLSHHKESAECPPGHRRSARGGLSDGSAPGCARFNRGARRGKRPICIGILPMVAGVERPLRGA